MFSWGTSHVNYQEYYKDRSWTLFHRPRLDATLISVSVQAECHEKEMNSFKQLYWHCCRGEFFFKNLVKVSLKWKLGFAIETIPLKVLVYGFHNFSMALYLTHVWKTDKRIKVDHVLCDLVFTCIFCKNVVCGWLLVHFDTSSASS